MLYESKINKANKILKSDIEKCFNCNTWIYKDFILEDRFLDEIREDEQVSIKNNTAQELADYAFEKILGLK